MTNFELFMVEGASYEVQFAGGGGFLGCLIERNDLGALFYLGSGSKGANQQRAFVPWSAVQALLESNERIQTKAEFDVEILAEALVDVP